MSSGCLLEPATGFAGSSMTMASSLSYTIAMVGDYVTNCCLYSAHKLCQITWHSGPLAQLEQHIIVGICCLSQLLGFICAFTASDNRSSSVYCSKVPDNRAVVNSTALTGHGGGHVTCLAAAHLAASFHVLPVMAFFDRLLANGSITSVMHSEVSLAFLLSQWRTFSSSSVPSFHSGHVVGALNRIQPSLLFGNLY